LSDACGSPAHRNALELRPQLASFPTDVFGVAHGGHCLRICIANTNLFLHRMTATQHSLNRAPRFSTHDAAASAVAGRGAVKSAALRSTGGMVATGQPFCIA